jgi:hypothetical protein
VEQFRYFLAAALCGRSGGSLFQVANGAIEVNLKRETMDWPKLKEISLLQMNVPRKQTNGRPTL